LLHSLHVTYGAQDLPRLPRAHRVLQRPHRLALPGRGANALPQGGRAGSRAARRVRARHRRPRRRPARFLPEDVQYQGIEIAPEFARPDVLIQDLSKGIPFPDGSYDFVFSIDVLEHVPNPFGTLTEVHRVLTPAGVLILSVPNPYHFKEIIWNVFRVPDRRGHIYAWPRQTMTMLGEMNGFRLERTAGTYLHPPIPMITLLAR